MEVTNRDVLKVFWQHTRKYKGRVFLITFSVIVAVLFEAVGPWILKDLIDTLSTGVPSPETWSHLVKVLGSLALIWFIGWFFWRLQGFIAVDVQPRVMVDLETSSLKYLLGHSYSFFTNNFAGSLVRKISRLSRAFERFNDEVTYRFLPLLFVIIGTLVGLFLRLPILALVFLIWTIIVIIFNYFAARWKLKIDVARAALDSEATGVCSDVVSNINTVHLFGGQKFEDDRFAAVKESWRKLQTKGWRQSEYIFAIQVFLMLGMEVGILYIGIKLWMVGQMTPGDLILLQTYVYNIFNKLWDLSRGFRGLFESFADAKEMTEILKTKHEVADRVKTKDLKVRHGKIEFKKVKFFFNKKREILENFSMVIKPREKTALVGPSGAGKTTVTKLLLRLFDIKGGKITIDGQDISKVSQQSLRQAISLVPQESVLFHRTIMDNIRYGRRDATDEEVIEAAKKAHCHEFIDDLPNGYATYAGERGVKLSGGERQRVAIARAILKNAPILVLDEATSSLDSESESLIQAALRELMKDKTVIVIAHRLSTIMMMDRIVVIDKGKVVATGTHNDLLEDEGIYQKLWRIQAGGFIGE